MAQTRRRRRSKHRGTAAGTIQARGRTGRKPATAEKARASDGRGRRPSRFDQPPTWRGALTRAALASGIFFAFVVIALHRPLPAALGLAAFTLVIYVPLGYYTDLFLYRRRQRTSASAPRARPRSRGR